MMAKDGVVRLGGWVFAALGWLVLAGAPQAQEDEGEGGGMEQFEEVDPYTQGDREKMKLLGYVGYGPFLWRNGDSTAAVTVNMGDIPMLWVETAHFRIGSTLNTYRIEGDKEEKAALKEELARLKKKLGKKVKFPKSKLDPWLRLHLFAQRAEDAYAQFHEDFGVEPKDYETAGPYLGQPEKMLILLCQRKSEFGRHMRTYVGVETEQSYRWGWPDGTMFWGANVEALRENYFPPDGRPFDRMLHCRMVGGIAANCINGYRKSLYGAPRWLGDILSHVYVRRIDPRWVGGAGYEDGRMIEEDDHKWEGRVYNLVKNEFFVSTETMFTWQEYKDLNTRDHMVAWSKLTYLLDEVEGDHRGFLHALCQRRPQGSPEEVKAKLAQRQTEALAECFQLTPAEFDERWSAWALKAYKRMR